MNEALIALLASAGLCGLAWLTGASDVRTVAAIGTICMAVTVLCSLWRHELSRAFRRGRSGPPVAGSSPSLGLVALIMAIVLLAFMSRLGNRNGISLLWSCLVLSALATAIVSLVRSRRARPEIRRDPSTPVRTSPPRMPRDAVPTPPTERPRDFGKTRPMPRT